MLLLLLPSPCTPVLVLSVLLLLLPPGQQPGLPAHLCILRQRHVNQCLGSGVHHIQQLHDGGTIIGDGYMALHQHIQAQQQGGSSSSMWEHT